LIGTELVQQKQFEAVVLVTIAIGGTSIAQWAPGGNLHAHLMSAVDAVGPAFSYTHVFIQQGETDLLEHTTAEDYFRRFAEVIAMFQSCDLLLRSKQSPRRVYRACTDRIRNVSDMRPTCLRP
jgi:hypothetical protein